MNNVGKQFTNKNTRGLYVLEKIDQAYVTSLTDIRNIFVIRNVETNAISRWEQTLFWQMFRPKT